jgi:hypothetical protein
VTEIVGKDFGVEPETGRLFFNNGSDVPRTFARGEWLALVAKEE